MLKLSSRFQVGDVVQFKELVFRRPGLYCVVDIYSYKNIPVLSVKHMNSVIEYNWITPIELELALDYKFNKKLNELLED